VGKNALVTVSEVQDFHVAMSLSIKVESDEMSMQRTGSLWPYKDR
jgi:hypothetical protein